MADSIGRANLEMVEPLARRDLRQGNAAAPRRPAAVWRERAFRGEAAAGPPPSVHRIMPAKPPPAANGSVPSLDMQQPCALLELDDGRCHWPLGDVHQVATLFCGGATVPRRCYCAHHLRRARAQGTARRI
jgi:hypothetical protein